MKQPPLTIPPRRPSLDREPERDPIDAVIEALKGVSVAVRELSGEVNTMCATLTGKIDEQAGRIDGLSRGSQELAREVREFGNSKERLMGRVAALELMQGESNGNGHA